jgi:membrane protein CcdC involved in cytochrome C biogenesis
MKRQTRQGQTQGVRRESFLPLLFALVCVLVATPVATEIPLLPSLLISVLLLSGLFAVASSRTALTVAVVGLLITLALRWTVHFLGPERTPLVVLTHLTMAAYLGFLCGLVVVRVLAHQRITRDTVTGALCGYLLIAYIFGALYAALARLAPASLSVGSPGLATGGADTFVQDSWTLTYFSLTTLTTLGYGDILPVSPLARSLAMLEALTGQLYLAAFVARLVGAIGPSPRANALSARVGVQPSAGDPIELADQVDQQRGGGA